MVVQRQSHIYYVLIFLFFIIIFIKILFVSLFSSYIVMFGVKTQVLAFYSKPKPTITLLTSTLSNVFECHFGPKTCLMCWPKDQHPLTFSENVVTFISVRENVVTLMCV